MRTSVKAASKTTAPSAGGRATIDAAALQDHLLRSLSVDLSDPVKRPIKNAAAPALTAVSNAAKPAVSGRAPLRKDTIPKFTKTALPKPAPAALTSISKPEDLTAAIAKTWTCDGCGKTNNGTQASCACGSTRAGEVVIVAPKLSLAQQRGLVAAPAKPLSASDWDAVEATAKHRAATTIKDAGGRMRPSADGACCVICMEPFGLREQVLLSCSHVFHRNCLESFERYARSTLFAVVYWYTL
jgi:hypothetical protein